MFGAGFSVGVASTVAGLPSDFALFAFAGAAGFLRPERLSLRRSLLLSLVVADGDDLQDRVLLAMALLAAIIVPATLLEDGDLVALGLGDDLRRDGQAVGLT